MDYILSPDTGQKIYAGAVVMLKRFPGTKWTVNNDWYTFNGQQYQGWYFSSIPAKNIVPVTESDLAGIVVVSSGVCPPPCPPPPCPGPGPKPPDVPFTPEMAWELNRVALTVDTIAERNILNRRLLPNGKIVKVNNDGTGKPAYFSWNQITMNWDTETFGIDTSQLVNRLELQIVNADLQAFKENVQASNESISQRLDTIDENVTNINQDIDNMEQQIVQLESNPVQWNELK